MRNKTMHTDKVIVSNLTALRAKYGVAGTRSIIRALKDLIAADRKRGLTTVLVALDDVRKMKTLRAARVENPRSRRQNKRAVDGVCRAFEPHYLMLLGAIDVIPHQALKNPLYSPPYGDTDEFVFADLP